MLQNTRGKARIARQGFKMEGDQRMLALRAGYNDKRTGAAPEREWADHPRPGVAKSYENGRLMAANIASAGRMAPPWTSPIWAVPAAVQKANIAACAAVGDPIPPRKGV